MSPELQQYGRDWVRQQMQPMYDIYKEKAMNVDITASLNEKQLKELITKHVEKEMPQYSVTSITFDISPGYDDRWNSWPAYLRKVDIKLAAKR